MEKVSVGEKKAFTRWKKSLYLRKITWEGGLDQTGPRKRPTLARKQAFWWTVWGTSKKKGQKGGRRKGGSRKKGGGKSKGENPTLIRDGASKKEVVFEGGTVEKEKKKIHKGIPWEEEQVKKGEPHLGLKRELS